MININSLKAMIYRNMCLNRLFLIFLSILLAGSYFMISYLRVSEVMFASLLMLLISFFFLSNFSYSVIHDYSSNKRILLSTQKVSALEYLLAQAFSFYLILMGAMSLIQIISKFYQVKNSGKEISLSSYEKSYLILMNYFSINFSIQSIILSKIFYKLRAGKDTLLIFSLCIFYTCIFYVYKSRNPIWIQMIPFYHVLTFLYTNLFGFMPISLLIDHFLFLRITVINLFIMIVLDKCLFSG